MSRQAEARAVELGEPSPTAKRRGAERVRSVTTAFPLPPSATRPGDPPSPLLGRLAATFAIPSDLPRARPASLEGAWEEHKAAAAHWNGALPKYLRLAWGCGDVAFLAVEYALQWVRRSPARFIVAALIVAALWFWL